LIDLLKFGKIRWFSVITHDISNSDNELVRNRALEKRLKFEPKGSCCFSYSIFISKISKGKKIYLLVLNNQSISDENDNNSDYEIHDDEDQDISEKEDTGKEVEDDEDKKDDSFHFCNKKITTDNVC